MTVDPSKLPAIARWSRPGFISRMIGSRKAENFQILRTADDNLAIPLTVGNGHLEWQNGRWENRNLDVQPTNDVLSRENLAALQRENAELQIECEILLHILTVSEITKSKAQRELNDLRGQISEAIGNLDEDSD
jgi:hypothetical protein